MTIHVGAMDQCRHCGHIRSAHHVSRTGLSTRLCHSSGACECKVFAPSHLTWWPDAHEVTGPAGTVMSGLPSYAAATQLAQTLTDLDDMFARIVKAAA